MFTAGMAYENVWAPHRKDVSDYNICVADHGLSACKNGIPFEEAGPHLPNPYVPYAILGVSGPLAILFAWFGVAWVREGLKPGPVRRGNHQGWCDAAARTLCVTRNESGFPFSRLI